MSRLSARSILGFAQRCLQLKRYLQRPGDGRARPRIAAQAMLWAMLMGTVLRENSFHAMQWWARSKARRRLGVRQRFSNDALAYFAERLDPQPTRIALATAVRRAKRNKAFEGCRYIGLALDGSSAGRCSERGCELCHPILNEQGAVQCYLHQFVMISVVGTGLSLPVRIPMNVTADSADRDRSLRRRALAGVH